jgi:HAD superfamily hydrolase (TIGR01509 family)
MVASTSGGVKHPVRAVIFDYGGVLRGDGREGGAAADAERAETALSTLEADLAGLPAVDAGMRTLVDRLRAAGRVKLGLLSNANRGWTERFRARGIAALFDDVVVSADVGLAKPDPAIFRLAADRLHVAPDACLMIDDQPQHVRGAQAAGMRSQLFESNGLALSPDWWPRVHGRRVDRTRATA